MCIRDRPWKAEGIDQGDQLNDIRTKSWNSILAAGTASAIQALQCQKCGTVTDAHLAVCQTCSGRQVTLDPAANAADPYDVTGVISDMAVTDRSVQNLWGAVKTWVQRESTRRMDDYKEGYQARAQTSVSYTHLTLPTILRV